MTNPKHVSEPLLVNTLAAAYAKAMLQNPQNTVYDNIEIALSKIPILRSAPEVLERLKMTTDALQKVCEFFNSYHPKVANEILEEVGINRLTIAKAEVA